MESLLIEKKSNIVDPTKVRIPINYVLVLPDAHHEFYHDKKGEEMNIQVGKSLMVDVADEDDLMGRLEETVITNAQHYSVRGKVYAVPDKLNFPKKEIKRLRENFGNNDADMKRLGEVVSNCLEWEVDMEVSVGDEVIFDYLAHIGCYEDGRWVETELGDMFLMRYDELNMVIRPDGNREMLNGWMLISREEKPKKSESGLDLYHKDEDDITKKEFAKVLVPGKPVKSYKQDFDLVDDPYDFREGQRILYKPGGTRPLEWVLHQTLYPGKKALLIHRKDIFYAIEDGQ